jgi:hypothetical protein
MSRDDLNETTGSTEPDYEPPAIEELSTAEGPAATAAGQGTPLIKQPS